MNATSGQDFASVTAKSECGDQVGIFVLHGNVLDRKGTSQKSNPTDKTLRQKPVNVSEFPVPEAYFVWQPHIHHFICQVSIHIGRVN